MFPPSRIVCLTDETVETLYLLGEQGRHRRDLLIGSWCGKKFRPERVATRAGFDRIPAVQHQDLCEIKSSLILPRGPPH